MVRVQRSGRSVAFMSLVVIAQNISNLAPESEYDVEVSVNRRRFIFTGRVAHTRADGAATLLRKIADAMDAAPRHKDGT